MNLYYISIIDDGEYGYRRFLAPVPIEGARFVEIIDLDTNPRAEGSRL